MLKHNLRVSPWSLAFMADDAPLQFGCPQCLARLSAPAALAGERIHCPRCQWSFKVPRHSVVHTATEGYAVQGESGSPAAEEPAYILTVCPVCHTRMFPTEDEIGEETVCPDCGTRTLVTRAAERPKKKPFRSPEEIGEYPLAKESAPAEEPEWVTVWCPMCHTRMYASPEEAGNRLICPDCGTAAVVPAASPRRPKPDPMAGADEGYRLAAPAEETEKPSGEKPRGEAGPVDERFVKHRRLPLPARPFRDGTFFFPFYPGTRYYMAGLSACFAVMAICFVVFGLFIFSLSAFVLGVMGLTFASSCALAIVRDSAEGFDEITSWPGFSFTEWMFDPLYLFNALCVSFLPGYGLAWLLSLCGVPSRGLAALGAFFLFPVMLLSMLETGSAFGVASGAVWRTMRVAGRGWLSFYAASGVLAGALGVLALAIAWIGSNVGIVVGVVALVIAWFIYFRLLGRLAWYCADRTADAEAKEEEEAE